MKELISLVETNLRSKNNIVLGEEKRKSRILNMVFLFILFVASSEVSFVRIFDALHSSNNQILILNFIINTELIIAILFILIQIINTFYLASDWKEMMVYPIKAGNNISSHYNCCSNYIPCINITNNILACSSN